MSRTELPRNPLDEKALDRAFSTVPPSPLLRPFGTNAFFASPAGVPVEQGIDQYFRPLDQTLTGALWNDASDVARALVRAAQVALHRLHERLLDQTLLAR